MVEDPNRDSTRPLCETASSKPSTILVAASGYVFGPTASCNLGDRAQLTCTLDRLRSTFPGVRLVAVANSLNDKLDLDGLEVSYAAIRYLKSPLELAGTRLRVPIRASLLLRAFALLDGCRRVARRKAPRLLSDPGRKALAELTESSALYISGAGAFNDLYIRGVGGFWGVLIRCLQVQGKPAVASGQQIGPLQRRTNRALARWALSRLDLLGVRDAISVEVARSLGLRDARVVLTGDDAWGLTPGSVSSARAATRRAGVSDGSFIAAQMRFGYGWEAEDSKHFADVLHDLFSALRLPIVFVPCATSSGLDDRYAAATVRHHLAIPSYAIEDALDPATTKAVIAQAALAIGTANHFTVFAGSSSVPVIAIYASAYMEQKLKGLARLSPGIAAISKDQAFQCGSVLSLARDLLKHSGNAETEMSGISPNTPVQALSRMLSSIDGTRSYRLRFAEDAAADAYQRELDAGGFMSNVSRLERNALRSALSAKGAHSPVQRHLDFACGSGRAIGFVEGLTAESIGVDVSEAMLRKARARFPEARFLCGDPTDDPYLMREIAECDLVTLWRFIASAEPELRAGALEAIPRYMSDDALLVVNNNSNRASLQGLALWLRARLKGVSRSSPYRQGTISHRELCRLLSTVGLVVEETKAICYLPEQVSRRLPPWVWMPLEKLLARLNVAPAYAANQLVLARRPSVALGATHRAHPGSDRS